MLYNAARSLALLSIPLLALAVSAGGCGSQPGKTIFTQGPNSEFVMGEAPETGTYALYTATSPNPTTTVKLNEGDPLGFRKSDKGRIEAVAGDQSTELGAGTSQAYWKLKK